MLINHMSRVFALDAWKFHYTCIALQIQEKNKDILKYGFLHVCM